LTYIILKLYVDTLDFIEKCIKLIENILSYIESPPPVFGFLIQ